MSWWEQGLRLLLAVFIGCVIGIERERKNRPAGMRTHVLVCVGASIIAIMESLMIADTITLNMNNASTGIAISYGRISAQVISGIGFLGAGTIFISQLRAAISGAAGEVDHVLVSPTENIVCSTGELAVLGDVTWQ